MGLFLCILLGAMAGMFGAQGLLHKSWLLGLVGVGFAALMLVAAAITR